MVFGQYHSGYNHNYSKSQEQPGNQYIAPFIPGSVTQVMDIRFFIFHGTFLYGL
jgi:hypothetical protein